MSTFNIRGALVVLTAAGALLLGALAAAPQAEAQTIHACVKKKGGAVRIVGAKTKCKKGETKLSWNTTGPAGITGLAGLPGATGATGATGAMGPMGPGATKDSFFEAPSAGDPEHEVLNTGPFRVGISCQTTGTPKEIKVITYTSVPEVPTTIDEEGSWDTFTSPISEKGEQALKPGEETGVSLAVPVTGPNGVPEMLFLEFGARTEEKTELGVTEPRGCWVQAEEI